MKLKEQGYFDHFSFVLDGQAIGFRFQEDKSFLPSQPMNPGKPPSVLSTRHREFYPCRKVIMAWNWQLKPTYI